MNFPDLTHPVVMGILNTTPDSFSDGGKLFKGQQLNTQLAVDRALQMVEEGAAIIDIGGESTRPGAAAVSVAEELDRTIPVIEALAAQSSVCISIDSSKAAVMQAAIDAGATLINDVCALQNEGALEVAATAAKNNAQLKVCLMHMQGKPQTMQQDPQYDDVVSDICDFLQERLQQCRQAGMADQQLIVDPGFGFGKTLQHNLECLRGLQALQSLGCPVLVGVSRKSMIGALTGNTDPAERLAGSLALAWACLQQGAKILRVHDVKQTVDLVKIYRALDANE